MTGITATIINEFVEQIDKDKEYDIKELKQILTDIYKAKTIVPKKVKKNVEESEESSEDEDKNNKRGRPVKPKKLDKNGNEKAKREPSAYNKYVKQRILALKTEQPDTKAKELMMIAAGEWKNLSKEEQEQYK